MLTLLAALTAGALSASLVLAQPATKLKVGYVPLTGAVSHFIAKDKGFYEKHGLDVDLIMMRSSADAIPGLVSNSLQIAMLPDPALIQAGDSGIDLVAVNGNLWLRSGTKDSAVIVRNGSSINGPKDFGGKRIGIIAIGSISQVLFEKWLLMNGVDKATISTILYSEASLPQQVDVIRTGTVDAVLPTEPFVTAILRQGGVRNISYFLGEMPDKTQLMLNASTRKWAASHEKEIAAFRKALDEATQYALANEKEARHSIIKWLKLPPEVVAAARFPDLSTLVTENDMKWWIATLKEQSRLRTDVDPAKFLLK